MDMITLKRIGGWITNACVDRYYSASIGQKLRNSKKISDSITANMAPSSTISKAPASRNAAISRPSTSLPTTMPPLKILKVKAQVHPSESTSIATIDDPLQENQKRDPHREQMINMHFTNCTGFQFFGQNDKENK